MSNGDVRVRCDDVADEIVRFCSDDARLYEIAGRSTAVEVRAPVDLRRLSARSADQLTTRVPALDEHLDGPPAMRGCTPRSQRSAFTVSDSCSGNAAAGVFSSCE